MSVGLLKDGAKLVGKSFVPWWMRIIYKVLKKRFKESDMATIEPDGGGERTVSTNRKNESTRKKK